MAIAIALKAAEVKLVEALGGIDHHSEWHAIEFHLGNLLEQYKSEYQLKIAVNLIHDLLKEYEGSIFLMADSSICVLCRRIEKTIQNKLIFQLRYLYMDDPLAYTEDGQENPDFCTVYDLSRDWQEFWDMSSRRMARSARSKPPTMPRQVKPAADIAPKPKMTSGLEMEGPLSASRLANIEHDLRYADLSTVIRRQPVCAAMPQAAVKRVFDELYIHIAHLRQQLKSDVDFFSNRWLFKYLTQILDERMIEIIKDNPNRYLNSPVSLNLNVETLLSSWFEEFDTIVKPEVKVSVVIEVPVVDVFADITGFMVAKNQAQKLGYRVCLDGLTSSSISNINRDRLGVDLVKVQWNADAASDLETPENQGLAAAVQAIGRNRVILCRCDNRRAVEYGQALGISLFQGRYLDSVLNPTSAVAN